MVLSAGQDVVSQWEALVEEIHTEVEQTRRELKEVELMLKQSQSEVEKLVQRNASITMHLQQVHSQLDTIPPEDIRTAYDAALDTQQRLLVMRGQVEKLQSDQTFLQRYLGTLERVHKALQAGVPEGTGQVGEFSSLERLIQAQESERRKLSRQMHDGPAQALSNFILQTDIAMRLFEMDPEKAKEELNNLKTAANSTFQQMRDFIFELRPMMLDDLGVVPTVKRFANAYKNQTGMDVQVIVSGAERRLVGFLEVMIFRAIQELLSNAYHHGQSTQVKVQIDITDDDIKVSVEDNGKGFEVDELDDSSGLGLKLIRERVQMMGGTMDVDSKVGHGTRVIFQVPAAKTSVFV
jgi:two-component system sensor histidine kinase DegS